MYLLNFPRKENKDLEVQKPPLYLQKASQKHSLHGKKNLDRNVPLGKGQTRALAFPPGGLPRTRWLHGAVHHRRLLLHEAPFAKLSKRRRKGRQSFFLFFRFVFQGQFCFWPAKDFGATFNEGLGHLLSNRLWKKLVPTLNAPVIFCFYKDNQIENLP